MELAYIENRFHLLSGQWDLYLLATAGLFFFLAYRFDNRFVLSLALSSLAGWFGLTISHWPSHQDAAYRQYAILYSLIVGGAGAIFQRRGLKPHFFGTYLNIAANVLFWALLSGVFNRQGYGGMVSGSPCRLWRVSRLGPHAPAVFLRRLRRRLRLRGRQFDPDPRHAWRHRCL